MLWRWPWPVVAAGLRVPSRELLGQRADGELLREPEEGVGHDEDYATREAARASIFESVEAFYNRARRHSTLGYLTPAEYERTHNQTHR